MTGSGSAWPVRLNHGPIGLRPLSRGDARAWREVRARNVDWLRPWEATVPEPAIEPPPTFAVMVRRLKREARERRTLPFTVTYDGDFAGQLTVGGITGGSLRACHIGYWIDSRLAGRGIIPISVALAADHVFTTLSLHRIEIAIRPENGPSRRVVEKLGLTLEGLRPRYLHIDGDWRDHLVYVVHREDVGPGGMLARATARRVV